MIGKRDLETEEAYTHEGISLSPTYHYVFTRYLWGEASYQIEQNKTTNVNDLMELKDEDLAREGFLSAVTATILWSEIDNPLDPEVGAKAGVIVEYAGESIFSDFSYIKVTGEVAGYYPLLPPVVTAIRGKIGWAKPLEGQEQLPLFKRFYSGGTGSIRGVGRRALGPLDPDKNPVGGAKSWEASVEIRYPIWEELGGVVFLDNGWVWSEDENYDDGDIFYTAGFGFRYKSPIGPIGIDFGFPLSEDDDVQKEILHINIGHAF